MSVLFSGNGKIEGKPTIIRTPGVVKAGKVQSSMRQVVMQITPADAEELLKGNKMNRKLSPRQIESHARDMKEGRWVLTHQGIALSPTYDVLDGQHRLHAIKASGVTVEMSVAFDVDPNGFMFMDRMRRKSMALIMGVDNTEAAVGRAGAILYSGDPDLVPAVGEVQEMLKRLKPYVSLMNDVRRVRPLVRDNAQVRLGVISCMLSSDADYALKSYRAFTYQDYTGMSIGMGSFNRWLTQKDHKSGGKDAGMERFVRAAKGFDKDHSEDARILIRGPVRQEWKALAKTFKEKLDAA